MPKVFISWSGGRGQRLAEALKETVFNTRNLEVWVSSQDIVTGSAWFSSIEKELQGVTHAVACITRDAILSPWVNFEAGALWMRLGTIKLLLFDIEEAQLTSSLTPSPFFHLQARKGTDKQAVSRLLLGMLDKSDKEAGREHFEGAWERWMNRVKEINRLSEDENVESLAQAILDAIKVQSRHDTNFDFIFKSCATSVDLERHGFPFDLALNGYLRNRSDAPKLIRTAYETSLLLKVMNDTITDSHVNTAVKATLDILRRGMTRGDSLLFEPWDTELFLAARAIDGSAKSVQHTPYANVFLLSFDGEFHRISPHDWMDPVLQLVCAEWRPKVEAD